MDALNFNTDTGGLGDCKQQHRDHNYLTGGGEDKVFKIRGIKNIRFLIDF